MLLGGIHSPYIVIPKQIAYRNKMLNTKVDNEDDDFLDYYISIHSIQIVGLTIKRQIIIINVQVYKAFTVA